MRAITWLFRAAVFFVLFAFALNNQHEVTVHWFFGLVSQGPMVFVVLTGFVLGCVVGVLAMTPRWWQQRRRAQALASEASSAVVAPPPAATRPAPLADIDLNAARRDGI